MVGFNLVPTIELDSNYRRVRFQSMEVHIYNMWSLRELTENGFFFPPS